MSRSACSISLLLLARASHAYSPIPSQKVDFESILSTDSTSRSLDRLDRFQGLPTMGNVVFGSNAERPGTKNEGFREAAIVRDKDVDEVALRHTSANVSTSRQQCATVHAVTACCVCASWLQAEAEWSARGSRRRTAGTSARRRSTASRQFHACTSPRSAVQVRSRIRTRHLGPRTTASITNS